MNKMELMKKRKGDKNKWFQIFRKCRKKKKEHEAYQLIKWVLEEQMTCNGQEKNKRKLNANEEGKLIELSE